MKGCLNCDNEYKEGCGQPTISLLNGFHYGVISGNLGTNSCLSTKCKHRFTATNFVNIDPASFDLDKATGDFSLTPTDPTKPWSFDFYVKSYDCTATVKGKTQFNPDGPATISGDPLISEIQINQYITDNSAPALADTLPRYEYGQPHQPEDDLQTGDLYWWRDHDCEPWALMMWDSPCP